MNGSIENFNGWFDEKFWAKETFTNLEDMRAKSTHFNPVFSPIFHPAPMRQVLLVPQAKSKLAGFLSLFIFFVLAINTRLLIG